VRLAFAVLAATLGGTIVCAACSNLQSESDLNDHAPLSLVELNSHPDTFDGKAISIAGLLTKTIVLGDYSGRDHYRLHYGSISVDENCREVHTLAQCAPITIRLADPLICNQNMRCEEGSLFVRASGIVSLDCLRAQVSVSDQTKNALPSDQSPLNGELVVGCPWGASIVLKDAVLKPIGRAQAGEAIASGVAQ
jgi:hypothetical protein